MKLVIINFLYNVLFKFTGHQLDHIRSFNDLVSFMYQPVDAASLGIFRMLFGLAMLIDIPTERGGSQLFEKWSNPSLCYFPLFNNWGPLLPWTRMGIIYAILWLGAIGITIGWKFRVSSFLFAITYWYIFLIDTSVWNNHSYLYGLCALLLLCSNAHRYCSVDQWLCSDQATNHRQLVPFWNYFIIKYQFFILYFVAGVKKLCAEWLSGYAMSRISQHWVFTPFRLFLGVDLTDLLIVHWFGCFFDVTIAFWLCIRSTRIWATPVCVAFHLMNSVLFSIGMFPWICLAQLPLFYDRSWPRKLLILNKSNKEEQIFHVNKPPAMTNKLRQRFVVIAVIGYCLIQAFLPFSHFLTPGLNNWTNGIYGYSWDMMVHAWDTALVTVTVRDNETGQRVYVDPRAYATDTDRWTKHADQAIQYAHCIRQNLIRSSSIASMQNVSIFFDVWCSLNGRIQQRFFDPNVDALRVAWSPFSRNSWTLELLDKEFGHMRKKMTELTQQVLAWNNRSDVMFVADFPMYSSHMFVSEQLENVTMHVLEGMVNVIKTADTSTPVIHAKKGEIVQIIAGNSYTIETVSQTPSCYMYTFSNRSAISNNGKMETEATFKLTTLLNLLQKHIENYQMFMGHIRESLTIEINRASSYLFYTQ